MLQDLSPLALAYCVAVLLLNFTLRGSLGFGGALGLPLLALALPVKVIAPAWSLVGIVSSIAIVGAGPIGLFAVIQFLVPNFYASVWDHTLTKIALTLAGCWMGVGNFIMYRMVNFRI